MPFQPKSLRCWPWLLAILSGLLLTLCFPGWNQSWLGWMALTPLIAAVWFGQPSTPCSSRWAALRPALLGYVTGLVFFWGVFSWLTTVTGVGWFALAFYMALYPALWGWFLGKARAMAGDFTGSWANIALAVTSAAAWVALEWVRGWLFSGFGWNNLGVALYRNLPLIQLAEYTGVAGLSFLIAFTNLILVITVRRFVAEIGNRRFRPHWDFSLNMALIAAVFLFGIRTLFQPPVPQGQPLRVAAVQANIPQEEKFDLAFSAKIMERYKTLSETALALAPQLLLWPEAATPGPLGEETTDQMVQETAARSDANFLLGSLAMEGSAGDFNIAALITGRGDRVQIYRKIHLVPFGEFIPFRHSFPLFAWIVGDLVPSDFTAGLKPEVFELSNPEVKAGPLICFEDTLGDLTRRFVQNGAQLLVNVTNDGWFLQSQGAEQHLANALFRTVENRRPLLRSANTGVTAFIDSMGRVTHSLRGADGRPFTEGVLCGEVQVPPATAPLTFYTRHGDLFAKTSAALSAAMILFLLRRKPKPPQ